MAGFRPTLPRALAGGDAFTAELFADPAGAAALEAFRAATLRRLFADSLSHAGAKINRRILGLAHVEDLESIADPDRRALCERRALALGRTLVVERRNIEDTAALRRLAESLRREERP